MIYIKRFLFVICYGLLLITFGTAFILSFFVEPFHVLFCYIKDGKTKTKYALYIYVNDCLNKIVNKLNPDKND